MHHISGSTVWFYVSYLNLQVISNVRTNVDIEINIVNVNFRLFHYCFIQLLFNYTWR